MIDLNAAQRRDPRGDGPAAFAADDVLTRLALWLADVAAEAAGGVRPGEAEPQFRDTMPEPQPAPVVAR